jgi:hypothetical protein
MVNGFEMGPVLLWAQNADNFEEIREKIKSEFGLVEAHHKETIPLETALVFPHPCAPNDLYLYRVRFNISHDYGPFIDFKYHARAYSHLLDKDLRALAIKRASELVEVVKVTGWTMQDVELPYVKVSSK